MDKQFLILVGVVPIYNRKLLITQRSLNDKFMPGAWGIPAGKIEFGEELSDAAHRELFEETGLDIIELKMIGESMFLSNYKGIETHNIQINYLAYVKSDKVKLDNASKNYKWLDIEDEKIELIKLDDFTKKTIYQAIKKKTLPNKG